MKLNKLVAIGKSSYSKDLRKYIHGYQHCYICDRLPQDLVKILSHSKGGICVHISCLSKPFLKYCKAMGLKVWTFSVKSKEKFIKHANLSEVDVVFCDDAKSVFNWWHETGDI